MISTPSVFFSFVLRMNAVHLAFLNIHSLKGLKAYIALTRGKSIYELDASGGERIEDSDCSVFASAKQLSNHDLNSAPGRVESLHNMPYSYCRNKEPKPGRRFVPVCFLLHCLSLHSRHTYAGRTRGDAKVEEKFISLDGLGSFAGKDPKQGVWPLTSLSFCRVPVAPVSVNTSFGVLIGIWTVILSMPCT